MCILVKYGLWDIEELESEGCCKYRYKTRFMTGVRSLALLYLRVHAAALLWRRCHAASGALEEEELECCCVLGEASSMAALSEGGLSCEEARGSLAGLC